MCFTFCFLFDSFWAQKLPPGFITTFSSPWLKQSVGYSVLISLLLAEEWQAPCCLFSFCNSKFSLLDFYSLPQGFLKYSAETLTFLWHHKGWGQLPACDLLLTPTLNRCQQASLQQLLTCSTLGSFHPGQQKLRQPDCISYTEVMLSHFIWREPSSQRCKLCTWEGWWLTRSN